MYVPLNSHRNADWVSEDACVSDYCPGEPSTVESAQNVERMQTLSSRYHFTNKRIYRNKFILGVFIAMPVSISIWVLLYFGIKAIL